MLFCWEFCTLANPHSPTSPFFSHMRHMVSSFWRKSPGRLLLGLSLLTFTFLLVGCGNANSEESQPLIETAVFATLVNRPTTTPTTPSRLKSSPTTKERTTPITTPLPPATPSPPTPTPVTIQVTAYKLNVRSGPGTAFERVTQVQKGAQLQAIGRNRAGDWLRVRLSTGETGWVAAQYTDIGDRVQSLPIVSE